MKKAIILLVIISVSFLGYAYYLMQKSSELISLNEEEIYEIVESNSSNSIASDEEFMYYFENMVLEQEDHIIINNCLQNIINENNNSTSSKCEDIILDVIIDKMGKTQLINAIIGNMINYNSVISFKYDFYKTLFPSQNDEKAISSKLIFTFINRYRNPEKLKLEFDSNKNYFFEKITKDLYEKLFEKTLNNFIDSYTKINEQEDKEGFYKKVYYEAETKNKHNEFWFITFWKRRELEKNDTIVYAILKEIKSHYHN
jgi:hypothetical protein